MNFDGSVRPGVPYAPRRYRLALFVVLAALLGAVSGPAALARPGAHGARSKPTPKVAAVPLGFVGVDVDGPVFATNTRINFDRQLTSMVANGVESVRLAFDWATAQPYDSWSQVPSGAEDQYSTLAGRPVSFAATDAVVQAAAEHHVTVLPTILYTPYWDARPNPNGVDTPVRNAPYAEYAAALVDRYGSRGIFWSEHPTVPKVPITMWQIWNEPNISYYWPQPFAKGYVSLLRLAHDAIKRADPKAKVVLGALTNFAWRSIGQIYKLGDTRNLFDIVSINGFTRTPANVILYMQLMRNAMDHFKDHDKPLLATEISWPSSVGQHAAQQFDFDTTEAQQARNIAALLPMIGEQRARLGLIGFYYYTWMGDEDKPHELAFQFSGLLRYLHAKVTDKPALAAFRAGALALEQCRQKGAAATSCVTPATTS